MGAAYDLFRNGKTAIKGSLGRYVGGLGASLTDSVNPANAIVNSTNRIGTDAHGNFRPDYNLSNFTANGECGAIDNAAFGTVRVVRSFADDALRGMGKPGVQLANRPGGAARVAAEHGRERGVVLQPLHQFHGDRQPGDDAGRLRPLLHHGAAGCPSAGRRRVPGV